MHSAVPIQQASFAGHESFGLRFAWLKKGTDCLLRQRSFFGNDDAMVELGVGKNMVRAIRHWGLAAQVWTEVDGSRGRELEPTPLGLQLFLDDGWDPYLEDAGTPWLLHWLICTSLDRATTWSWVFGRPKGNRFSKDEILGELRNIVRDEQLSRVPDSTLKRDIAVMVRSYCRPTGKAAALGDDALDSPFLSLQLLREGAERGSYELVQGLHPTLGPHVLAGAVLDYRMRIREASTPSIPLDELLYAPLSPGRTFRLTEQGMVDRLAKLVQQQPDVYAFDETAGLRQLLIREPAPSALQAWARHYSAVTV